MTTEYVCFPTQKAYSRDMNKTIDMGNNEMRTIGVTEVGGEFVALTLSQSATFKTLRGAVAWMARRGYSATGARV